MELLDFHAVRDQVAGYARFGPAKDLARLMEPVFSTDEVERLQGETAEGLTFVDETPDVDLHIADDPSAAVARAALEGTLTGLDLLAVAVLLEVQHRARSALLRVRDRVPRLASMAEGIPDLEDTRQQISSCIGIRGEVLDTASPVLGDLRRGVREAYRRVTEALDGVIQSSTGREALQDQVVSMRGDRLVVQVKTEMRHRVPGVVHDASNSGATLFIEPFATVDLCNTWREMALEEERETARVLRDLSAMVGFAEPDIKSGSELTARLDLILARARYSKSVGGADVQRRRVSPEGLGDDDSEGVRLLQARHPLLGGEAVPITVSIGPGWSVLVITGPNTGGKTVAMKTVGLLALMHQCGLRAPVGDGSHLRVFDGVYADLGDQQSIEHSVSTFGSHMRNVIDILSSATPDSLVLLDELGTSTDPEEGSALAKAILDRLAYRGISTIVTTHHRTVAAHAEAAPAMTNASVDLDPATFSPTYHLTTGVPGRSYAMSVASQMGLPEEIMENAQSLLEPQHRRFEDWLNELQHERTQLKERLEEANEVRARAEASRRDFDGRLEDLASHREELLHNMRAEASSQFDEVRKKLRRAEAAISWGASPVKIDDARSELQSAVSEMDTLEPSVPEEAPPRERRGLAVGDAVDVRGLNVRGTLVSIFEQGREMEVAVGDVHFRLDAHRLMPAHEEAAPEPSDTNIRHALGPMLTSTELHVRGLRAEEALMKVEDFLDKALRDGLSSVRIIHGRGTGALRRAVRELLEQHPLAKSYAPEEQARGGDGVTVVEL